MWENQELGAGGWSPVLGPGAEPETPSACQWPRKASADLLVQQPSHVEPVVGKVMGLRGHGLAEQWGDWEASAAAL